MNTTKKMTKAEKFAMLKTIPAVAENEMLVEFIDHEIDLLTRKNSGEHKPTKTQKENEGIRAKILEGMETDRIYTVTEIQKEIEGCAELTNQKISALLRPMVAEGLVIRTVDKRKAYFSKA